MSPRPASVRVDAAGRGVRRLRLWPFIGPAMLVSVGYMDPGNWATDLEGGARFGYQLIWVLALSNLAALLLQTLCARLGVVSGLDLAQACRRCYPRAMVWTLWLLCEIAIVTCDLAEVIGAAVALDLLFGIPLAWGAAITALDVLLLLWLQGQKARRLEALIAVCVLTVAGCFAVELYLVGPDWNAAARALVPHLSPDALYVAVGILGATVMPHNLYLHSAAVKTRIVGQSPGERRAALRYNFIDTLIALNFAFLINSSILLVAAALYFSHGVGPVDLREAHRLLQPLLGVSAAATLFGVALLCAGQSATITGTMAGQVVMEGFLELRVSPIARRLLTRGLAIVPAIALIAAAGEQRALSLLVSTQVVLSLQLPFAIVPLLRFTASRALMGEHANGVIVKALGVLAAAAVIGANLWLGAREISSWGAQAWLAPLGALYLLLLGYTALVPLASGPARALEARAAG
jgi:manganese transport protein